MSTGWLCRDHYSTTPPSTRGFYFAGTRNHSCVRCIGIQFMHSDMCIWFLNRIVLRRICSAPKTWVGEWKSNGWIEAQRTASLLHYVVRKFLPSPCNLFNCMHARACQASPTVGYVSWLIDWSLRVLLVLCSHMSGENASFNFRFGTLEKTFLSSVLPRFGLGIGQAIHAHYRTYNFVNWKFLLHCSVFEFF